MPTHPPSLSPKSIVRNKLVVMPGNSSGWFWHTLAHETGRLAHLYSPGAQRGPWPWFPVHFDNGCFSLWNPAENTFDEAAWKQTGESAWHRLLFWGQVCGQPVKWAIVPDRPGDALETLRKWRIYAPTAKALGFPLALAVQDGMDPSNVDSLEIQPDVICVGGSTEWKWASAEMWARNFKRTHLLRCNAPERLPDLDRWGFESCDGTGWSRGDRKQTQGLEEFLRQPHARTSMPLWPHVCRVERKASRQFPGQPTQEAFA